MTSSVCTKRLTEALRIGAVLLLAVAARADWPLARGGAQSTGATEVSLPDEPKIAWTYESGGPGFEATPVIAGGVAYLGDADGTVHAVRLADGSLVWKKKLGETFILTPGAVFTPPSSETGAPAARFVVVDADGLVHALAAADGATLWTHDTGSEAYAGPSFAKLDGGRWGVLVPTESGRLDALDLETGEPEWDYEIPAPLRCLAAGGLLAGCDAKLHAIDTATGAEQGAVDLGDPTGNTAARLARVAYFGTEGGEFYAVDVSDRSAPAVKWTYHDPRRRQGIRTDAAVTPAAVVYANQAKVVYALDPATGEPLWTQRTRSAVEASPLALGDGRVLILTTRGRVRLLDGKTGEEAWSYEAGGQFLASPAAAEGRVLVANADGKLICLGKE